MTGIFSNQLPPDIEKMIDEARDQEESPAGMEAGRAGNGAAQPTQHDPEPPWPILESDALHGLAGEVVRAIEPHTESDPVALLVQFLAYFGNAAGRHAFLQVESDRHYPNLFAVLVGQSSKSRKGTSAGRIREIMSRADASWADKCIGSGLSSGEGVIWNVRDPIYKQKNGERVLDDEGVADKRPLLDEHEMFRALTVMKREGNTLSRIVRDAWDRSDLACMTKHSPASATGAHISIIGHITADELRRNLDHTALMNGFANAWLAGQPRDAEHVESWGVGDQFHLSPDGRRVRPNVARDLIRDLVAVDPGLLPGLPQSWKHRCHGPVAVGGGNA